eukprot:sb/3469149/
MLGRKVSLEPLVTRLTTHGVTRVTTTEFRQGNTTRWGLAWSFSPTLPPTLQPANTKKPSTIYSFSLPSQSMTFTTATSLIGGLLREMHVQVTPCPTRDHMTSSSAQMTSSSGHVMSREDQVTSHKDHVTTRWVGWVTATENTWSHGRRKRRQEQFEKENCKRRKLSSDHVICNSQSGSSRDVTCLFHSVMSVERNEEDGGVTVDFGWIFGTSKDSLNQFCCTVATRLSEHLEKSKDA